MGIFQLFQLCSYSASTIILPHHLEKKEDKDLEKIKDLIVLLARCYL